MRSVWAAAFLMRRLRAEFGVVLLIVALVGITSFLFAGAPRLFNLVADQGLRHEIASAPPSAANLELSRAFVVPSFEDPLAVVGRQGSNYLERFPASIRSVVADEALVATSPRFSIAEPPRYTTFVSLRHQDGLDPAIELVDGRLPAATGELLPAAAFGFVEPSTEPPPSESTRIEIAVSDVTARAIGVEVGDTLAGSVDDTDPLVPRVLAEPLLARLEVVGIFSIEDPAADIWYGDYRLAEPGIRGSVDDPIAFATGLIAPGAYPEVVTSELPFRYEWRYFVAPDRVDAGQLDALVPDLRRLATQYGTITSGGGGERLVLRGGLLGVVERYLAERAASEAVLSIAAIGPVALAAGAIAMSAVLLVARRRPNLVLARDRGASRAVILGAQLWEAALVAGFASLAGLLLAITIVPGRASGLSTILALATGLGAVAVLVVATVPVVRGAPAHAGRDEAPPVRTSPRRLVLELTAVGIAIAGVLLLQQRGLQIGGAAGGRVVRFDPLLAAVPLLTGLAVAVVATRLYPWPIRLLGWLAARRRDLVPVLGLRNVGRRSSFAMLPLLILMLTAAFGSFASVVMASIDRGQLEASWAGVGADYRVEIEDGSLAALDLAGLPGAEGVAAGFLDPDAIFAAAPNERARIRLHALDADAYRRLAVGTSIDPAWPASFLAPVAGRTPGTEDEPVPAIVSQRLPAGSSALRRGATFHVAVGDATTLTFEVVDVRTSFPGVPPGVPFVVAPLPELQAGVVAAGAPRPLEPNLLFVRGDATVEAGLTELVDADAPSAVVTSRHAWYAGLRTAPLIAVVADGFRVALLVAGAYAALAVLAALTLTAARRTQDLAFLRTLGLSARQAIGVTIVEHGTPVVVALVPGIVTGIVIARLLESSLGLGAFIGPEIPFRIHVDGLGIALVAGSLMIVVAVAIVASTWLARRARAVDALRVGDA